MATELSEGAPLAPSSYLNPQVNPQVRVENPVPSQPNQTSGADSVAGCIVSVILIAGGIWFVMWLLSLDWGNIQFVPRRFPTKMQIRR